MTSSNTRIWPQTAHRMRSRCNKRNDHNIILILRILTIQLLGIILTATPEDAMDAIRAELVPVLGRITLNPTAGTEAQLAAQLSTFLGITEE